MYNVGEIYGYLIIISSLLSLSGHENGYKQQQMRIKLLWPVFI